MSWSAMAFPPIAAATVSSGDFPTVTLDADSVQKFAEIEVQWDESGGATSSVLVRGLQAAELHRDAAQPTMRQLRRARICATVVGGGRIRHDSSTRSIFVYGYSMEFGQANLSRVAELCRQAYPGYNVSWSKEGY